MPDIAYDLDYNTSFSWQLSMVTLSTSLLWGTIRDLTMAQC